MRQAFNEFDTDGDGEITLAELESTMNSKQPTERKETGAVRDE